MKNLLLITLLGCCSLTTVSAQSGNTYQDDIYMTGSDVRKQAERKKEKKTSQADNYDRAGDQNFDQNAENTDYSGDSYVDYDDDNDYTYATRLNRFGYNSFYNRPYYSAFNNPYWYNPYWVDPYWGWSPWASPGISVSFGGGPYWGSYWGWQSWYGYNGFNSFYYPSAYSCGWGSGYGYGGYGCGGGFYGNYWNGYYAGVYNNGGYNNYSGRGRSVTYGPRYSMNSVRNNTPRNFSNNTGRSTLRTTQPNGNIYRSGNVERAGRNANFNNNNAPINAESPSRGGMRQREGRFYNEAPSEQRMNNNGAQQMNDNRYSRGDRNVQMDRNEPQQQQSAPVQNNNFRNRSSERMQMNQNYNQQQAPMQNNNFQQSAPVRQERSAPSYNGGGQRGGGFNGGGGSRGGGFGGGGGGSRGGSGFGGGRR
ncbi:MAG: hypothetical protein WC716_07605 [Chitinophagaceae bacterium]|jgi:hypothetical protein